MAFCTNCGSKVEDGTKFCPNCGQSIETNTASPVVETAAVVQAPQEEATQAQPPQQSYQPPQQSYQPSQQTFEAAEPPKQKKPLNKTLLFIILGAVLAVVLAVVLIVVLSANCGGTAVSTDPNVGVYTASQAEMLGITMDVSDLFENGVTIELKDKGKCVMNVDGTTGNGTWTLTDGVFHIKGGGLDCDGTLGAGQMTIENMLGMGVSMLLVREGGAAADNTDGTTTVPQGSTVIEASELQKQWAGTWYGCLYVDSTTGDMAQYEEGVYNVYMVVDIDGEGNGDLALYVEGNDKALALANCTASSDYLSVVDGSLAGQEMSAYEWMFMPLSDDFPDLYIASSTASDFNGDMDLSLFVKQWGKSWQDEIDSGYIFLPPDLDAYTQAIADGEEPPCGFAPYGYNGEAATTEPADEPADTDGGDGSADAGGLLPNEPSSSGDGVFATDEAFYQFAKWLWDMEYDYRDAYCDYAFCLAYCGVEGFDYGNDGPNNVTDLGDHYFSWYSPDQTMLIHCGFRGREDGTWMLANFNISGFSIDDIPESITVTYDTP